ncbi:MAG: tetratricopeptide repeat protein, partial [Ruminococcus sp.]
HIQGDDPELSFFFAMMCYRLYLGENRCEDALWAAQQELRILRQEEDSRVRLINTLSFIQDFAIKLHDTEISEKAAAELAELQLSASEQFSVLKGVLFEYIYEERDFDQAKLYVEQIIQLAEEIGEPMKLALAYSNFIWLENIYRIDCNKSFYIEKTVFYANQCFAEQTAEQEQDISFWSELGDIYRDCEQFSRAMACYQKERELFQVQMQEEPMEASTKLVQLQTDVAVCNLKMKQFSEMEENYEEAITLANQLYGEEHEETGEIWATYACALTNWYNAQPSRELLEKCKAAMEQALEILLEHDVYGEVRIANLMMRYSSVLSELGEFQNCDIVAAEALECFQKNFGELHEQMEWVYLMMADNYRKAGDKENAKRDYDLAIRVLRANDYETDELEERVEEILQGM